MCSAQYYKFNANDKCYRCQIFRTFRSWTEDFLTNFHPTTTTILHLTVNYYCERSKANFERLLAAALTTEKDQRSKIPVRKYKQNSAVCVGERVLLNIKISRQKRRCRSRPPRQSDVRDDKNVCCLSSLIGTFSLEYEDDYEFEF